jgi:hypothetical protein
LRPFGVYMSYMCQKHPAGGDPYIETDPQSFGGCLGS